MRPTRHWLLPTVACALAGCAPGTPPKQTLTPVTAEAQRDGDAQKGYLALVQGDAVSCGIPQSLFDRAIGEAAPAERLPGRTGRSEKLRYDYTAITAPNGAKLVTVNCLVCHASMLDGKVVIGRGQSNANYTTDTGSLAEAAGALISDPAEKVEWRRWADRVSATGPYITSDTVGVNVADSLAPILFSHRDQKTFAWSKRPLLEPPPKTPVPTDTPPWWHMKKRQSMFFTGFGRGDQARIMMSAALLCTDTLAEAQAIDTNFPDVRAFIRSLQPPKYPHPIDAALASEGAQVFQANCARCHGTYGESPTYPELVVDRDEIGTDPVLIDVTAKDGPLTRFSAWFNGSFYGEKSRLDFTFGYVAPPLDGIWATAPYFHNASVPTVAAVLDSSQRPAFWTRDFEGYDFDQAALGVRFTTSAHGKDQEADVAVRARLYDTTRPGFGNGGHLYGDPLSGAERTAVLEYLKTL